MTNKVLKAIGSGKFKSLDELAESLEITIQELKGILDILTATKKISVLFRDSLEIRTCSRCTNCKGCGLKDNNAPSKNNNL